MMLVVSSVMSFAAVSFPNLGGLPNPPIYETVFPLVTIACLSFIGMLTVAGLKK